MGSTSEVAHAFKRSGASRSMRRAPTYRPMLAPPAEIGERLERACGVPLSGGRDADARYRRDAQRLRDLGMPAVAARAREMMRHRGPLHSVWCARRGLASADRWGARVMKNMPSVMKSMPSGRRSARRPPQTTLRCRRGTSSPVAISSINGRRVSGGGEVELGAGRGEQVRAAITVPPSQAPRGIAESAAAPSRRACRQTCNAPSCAIPYSM